MKFTEKRARKYLLICFLFHELSLHLRFFLRLDGLLVTFDSIVKGPLLGDWVHQHVVGLKKCGETPAVH